MPGESEFAHALAGAGGGALAMAVTYPLVTLSTLAQTTQKLKDGGKPKAVKDGEESVDSQQEPKEESLSDQSGSTMAAAREILRTKGVAGLFSGLESAVYGVTFSNFIYYYFYELTSNTFLRGSGRRTKGLSTLESIATGAVAGAITVCGTNPVWVANTRMMVKAKEDGSESQLTLRTIIEIAETDGFGTLFAGVLPALVLVINPIIQYTIFEQIKNLIVLSKGTKGFTASKAFFVGALGKLVATSLTYPYITLKSRMHVEKKGTQASLQLVSMYQQLKKIVRDEGFEGLYRGLGIKLSQLILMAAFLFYFKEQLLSGSVRLVLILQGVRLQRKIRAG